MINKVLLAAYNRDTKLLYDFYVNRLKGAISGFAQIVHNDHTRDKEPGGAHISEKLSSYGMVISDKAGGILRRSRQSYYIPEKTFEYITDSKIYIEHAKYIIAPSKVFVEGLAMDKGKTEVLSLGLPRMDKLFDKTYLEDCRKKLLESLNLGEKFVIFYYPLERDELPPFDYQTLKALDERLKNKNAVLLMKVRNAPSFSGFDCIKDARGYDIDVLQCAADMLISDYSSIIREYICLRRPIAFYPYDLDHFSKEHQLLYPIHNRTYHPGPIISSFIDIADYVDAVLNGQDEYAFYRERCLRTFVRYPDGRSTARIWGHILNELDLSDELIETLLEQDI